MMTFQMVSALAAERHHTLLAEAQSDRLARQARAYRQGTAHGRPTRSPWQRLLAAARHASSVGITAPGAAR